jgi:hypothetical protein
MKILKLFEVLIRLYTKNIIRLTNIERVSIFEVFKLRIY